MKKYFYTALALVAMAGCSKDSIETPSFDDSVQSIEISIENITTPTRAEGGITPAGAQTACADFSDLIFLFADSSGEIIAWKKVEDGKIDDTNASKITFHTVESTVTQVGVIANYEGWEELETLDAAEVAWKDETAMLANPYRNVTNVTPIKYGVVAYGEGNLSDSGQICTHDNVNYKLYNASVKIAPYMARIEIEHIGYTDDFGTGNNDFTMIGVEKLSLAGGTVKNETNKSANAEYTHILLPSFHETMTDTDWGAAANVLRAKHTHNTDTNVIKPESGVWSWNILPQKISNLVTHLYLRYPNHTSIVVHDRTVTINKYSKVETDASGNVTKTEISDFESGNIYRFAIDFGKSNLDEKNENSHICVDCTVEIANWVVNDIDVDFATGNNN